jgi:hypothetical protein
MTGLTFGAAHCVLKMLLPDEIAGRSLSEAPSAQLVQTYSVEGKTCFVVQLEGWSADRVVIDDSFALRRVGRVGPELSARPASPSIGLAQSEFTRVLTYEPELFDEEPPDMNMDW